jgi:hypothetical protein
MMLKYQNPTSKYMPKDFVSIMEQIYSTQLEIKLKIKYLKIKIYYY